MTSVAIRDPYKANIFSAAGQSVSGLATSAEVMEATGLNWEVKTGPVYGHNRRVLANKQEVYREMPDGNDVSFAVTSKGYKPWQQAEAFAWADSLVEGDRAVYETVIEGDKGKSITIVMDLKQVLVPIPGDEVASKLLITHRNDTGSAIHVGYTGIRFTCANQLPMAVSRLRGGKGTFSVRHNLSMAKQLGLAAEVLKAHQQSMDSWMNEVAEMVNQKFSQAEATQFVLDLVSRDAIERGTMERPTRLDDLDKTFQFPQAVTMLQLVESGAGTDIPGVRGTGWGMYNAVVEYTDHFAKPTDEAMATLKYNSATGRGFEMKQIAAAMALRKLTFGE